MNSVPSTTRQQCAYEGGQRAQRKGLALKNNPHKKGTVDHDWWQRGFEEMQDE